jgi:hypothetical protein
LDDLLAAIGLDQDDNGDTNDNNNNEDDDEDDPLALLGLISFLHNIALALIIDICNR